jgi:hypothetical protein
MKNGNGNGNLAGVSFTTAVIEENPYLQKLEEEQQQTRASAENEVLDLVDEDESASALDHTTERRKKTQRRRRLVLAGVALLLLVSAVCVFAFQYRSSTRVEYGQRAKQARVGPPAPNATTAGRDTRTEQAIEEAQRLTTDTRQETNAPPAPVTNAPLVATDATRDSDSNPATPFTVPPDIGGTVKSKSDALDSRSNTDSVSFNEKASTSSTATASANDARTVRSQRSSETSLYSNERANRSTVGSIARPNSRTLASREAGATVVLPSFGSMLPIRTIGGLYTLRSGALTRLELTRDMKGNGWSMKRGTILVGTSKGGEYDRAYVSIVGFIDPQSGKLVKLGGDVLGGDGGAGLKGKRRQLDGGWARMLGKVGTAALNVTGALVGGRGNGTVIISDGLRTRAVNPITDEISGVIGGELDQKQRRGFVEVAAGTTGYVMVTDLPSIIKGTEASPDLNEETLAAITDVDAARPATGLSERELAELLATGSPEEIRAAMPRMSPELRKIAAAVLEQ